MTIDLTRQGIITRLSTIEISALYQSSLGRGLFLFMSDDTADNNIYTILEGGNIQAVYNTSITTDANNNIILAASTSGTSGSTGSVIIGDVVDTTAKFHVNGNIIIDGNINSSNNISLLTNNTIGTYAGSNLVTGSNNLIAGYYAGRSTAVSTNLTTASNLVYLGANIKASGNNISNEIIIGANATGAGSNTVTIGDNNIEETFIQGDAYIGYSTANQDLYVKNTTTTNNLVVDNDTILNDATFNGTTTFNGQIKDYTNNYGPNKFLMGTSSGYGIWKSKSELSLIEGSGTAHYVPVFTSGSTSGTTSGATVGNSVITQVGAYVGVNTLTPVTELDVKLATDQHIQFSPNTYGKATGVPGIVSINDAGSAYTPIGFYASKYYFGNGNTGFGVTTPLGKIHVAGHSILYGNINSKYSSNVSNTNSIGLGSFNYITTGYSNIAVGTSSGAFTTALAQATSISNSVYLGAFTKTSGTSVTNEIVVGANAIGKGSNTTTIGVSGTTSTYLFGHAMPGTSGLTIGTSSNRWDGIYLNTSPDILSDAEFKTMLEAFSTDELNAAKALAKEIGIYKLLADVDKLGDEAKKHIGLSAQKVIEILAQNNLDYVNYDFVSYQDGIYSLKYTEIIMFILRGFEERLSALENI